MKTAVALAALAVGGCDGDDELLVKNAGVRSVLLEVVCITSRDEGGYFSEDHDHRFFVIPPDSIFVKDFGSVQEMEVFITTQVTGHLLFAGSFSGKDFADDHGRIEITVYP